MVGVITHWDILTHPISTIQCFGWTVFFRAIVPKHEQTFLGLLQESGFFRVATPKEPTILERCIALELRAKRIYERLGTRFKEMTEASEFLAGLAVQEQYHADLLEVCRAAAKRSGWKPQLFNPWQDYLPRLEQQMDATEAVAEKISSVEDALEVVIRVESSEINGVFRAALDATDSTFVKRLRPFQEAMEAHMTHIAERIPELCPRLLNFCRELRAKFPRVRI